jgi:Family of unknown function (DUF5906)
MVNHRVIYMPDHYDSQAEIDDINEKLKEAKKQKQQADKEAKKLRKKADAYAGIEDWLADTPIYYVAKLDRYVIKMDDGNWEFLKPAAMPRTYPILNDDDAMAQLSLVMEEQERTFISCTYTFHIEQHPQTLNLLDTTDWLKPTVGLHHWAFDVLIQSLGCNKPENMEHLKHVLAYKYEHPDCWLLPCLVIYGAGRVGKSVLVDAVLITIYCGRTITAIADNLVGVFNSLLKGKIIACINETVVGKQDRARLYNTLAKERAEINEKGVPQYEVDNLPLYLIASNDWNGATQLDRGEADERLSIMCCEATMTLKYWVAQYRKCSEDEAQDWLWTEGKRIFSDPIEVAKWLNYLLENYGGRKQPKALHGKDYEGVMAVQQKYDEKIVEAVFNDETFEYISVKDLHEGYHIICKEHGASYPIGMSLFNRKIEMWLKKNGKAHIEKITKTVFGYPEQSKADQMEAMIRNETPRRKRTQNQKTCWVNVKTNPDVEENNRDRYLSDTGYKTYWRGPEVI